MRFKNLKPNFVIVGVGGGKTIVWTEHEVLHDALDVGVDLSGQIARRQVPREKFV